MASDITLTQRLSASASGSWSHAAAVWLLIEHGHWLDQIEKCDLVATDADYPDWAMVDWEDVEAADDNLIGTDSERQVLDVALTLGLDRRANVSFTDLTSLDETNKRLVLHALAWAAGGRDWANSLRLINAVPTDATQVRIQKQEETRFRVRFRTDGQNRSRSFVHHHQAVQFAADLRANFRKGND